MVIIESRIKGASGAPGTPFMAEFEPLKVLWDGPQAPYPSEYSARWALRKMREELAKAQAVGLHRSRLMVNPQRFAEVAERAAIAQFAARAGV